MCQWYPINVLRKPCNGPVIFDYFHPSVYYATARNVLHSSRELNKNGGNCDQSDCKVFIFVPGIALASAIQYVH